MRRRLVKAAIDGTFIVGGAVVRRLPIFRPHRYGVERIRNVDYAGSRRGHHHLDVYRRHDAVAKQPAVLYLHGGAWRMLSKDTHFMMALTYAGAGYTVFVANYRLAPRHAYPAQLQDVATAYRFVAERGEEFGADPSRIVVAGESAGANLALALAVAAHFERPEPFARGVLECPHPPCAVAPACGLLQLSDVARLWRRRPLAWWLRDYLASIPEVYLSGHPGCPSLLDPLLVLESEAKPVRPLPPIWLGVGTKDPVLDDTRRCAAALERRGVPHAVEYYPGGLHAFQAAVPLKLARRFWRDQLRFLATATG